MSDATTFAYAIRPIGPADAMIVAALHAATLTENWSVESIVDIVALPSVGGQLAVAGPATAPAPIGFVLVMHALDQAEIVSIGVLPAWRRQGVGRALLHAAAGVAHARGAAALFLEVAAENQPAQALYAGQGFQPVGRRPHYYAAPDGGRQDAVVLQADLPFK